MTYSSELENFAQQWANNCVFEHSGGKFGRIGCVQLLALYISKCLSCVLCSENLAAGTGAYSIQEMINDWVVEVCEYWEEYTTGPGINTMTLQRITIQITRRRRTLLRSVCYPSTTA